MPPSISRFLSYLNKPIQPPLLKQGYHKHIEQYRGLCALLVLLTHGTDHGDMLVNNFTWPNYIHYFGAGYLSVIMFFCISGYVIAISNDHERLDIGLYLKKRLVRLYPIYIISLLLCIIVVGGISLFELTGNFFFLQNDTPYGHFKIPIFVNYPGWSLNYEVLYYLLFIALFFSRPKIWQLLTGMLVLSIFFIHCNPNILAFVSYLNGYYFWILGLLIGWKIIDGQDKFSTVPLLSMLFLHLCQHHLGLGQIVLHIAGIYPNNNFNWLFDLPFCFMIMCILTQKDNRFIRINKIVCYTLPAIVFMYLILHHRIFEDTRWIMCLIYWGLSLLLYNEKKVSAYLLEKLTSVGKISYALYLLHVPVALLIKKFVFIGYQPIELAVKFTLWIIITFSLAVFLELYCQPRIKKSLFSSQSNQR